MIELETAQEVSVSSVSSAAFESLATLQQLTLEAGLSENRKQLVFRIVNHTVRYCRYDRAALWGMSNGILKLLGVSGSADVNPHSPLATQWRSLVGALSPRDRAAVIKPEAFSGQESAWRELAKRTKGLSVIWLPICVEGRTVAGLWLERWGDERFSDRDLRRLEAIRLAYGVAWRSIAGKSGSLRKFVASRKSIVATAVAVLVMSVLSFVHVPLRIVAPCEVVPKDPVAVTAPLAGVIDEIPVWPGRSVEVGDLLAVYDKRVAMGEMRVVRQQVQIIESDLQRSRVQAFDNPSARPEIVLLEHRLEQEKTRLRVAQYRVDQLEIRAPVRGTLMFADPHEWRGRPVQVGERLMMIVDSQKTKLRIWLPETDNIDFDQTKPLTIILDSDPSSSRSATLRFLANHSEVNTAGVPRFRAEAEWSDPNQTIRMGLQGTAALYGNKVSLGYWLFRRPLGAIRRFIGV